MFQQGQKVPFHPEDWFTRVASKSNHNLQVFFFCDFFSSKNEHTFFFGTCTIVSTVLYIYQLTTFLWINTIHGRNSLQFICPCSLSLYTYVPDFVNHFGGWSDFWNHQKQLRRRCFYSFEVFNFHGEQHTQPTTRELFQKSADHFYTR